MVRHGEPIFSRTSLRSVSVMSLQAFGINIFICAFISFKLCIFFTLETSGADGKLFMLFGADGKLFMLFIGDGKLFMLFIADAKLFELFMGRNFPFMTLSPFLVTFCAPPCFVFMTFITIASKVPIVIMIIALITIMIITKNNDDMNANNNNDNSNDDNCAKMMMV